MRWRWGGALLGAAVVGCASLLPFEPRILGGGDLQVFAFGNVGAPPSASDVRVSAQRLLETSYRVRRAAAALCGAAAGHGIGFSFIDRATLRATALDEHAGSLRVGEEVVVLDLATDSPAQRAGVVKGDVVETLDGRPVGEGEAGLEALQVQFDRARASGEAFTLRLRRGAEVVSATIVTEPACDVLPLWHPYRHGGDQLRVDDETYTLVMAHELAHRLLGHDRRLQAALSGTQLVDVPLSLLSFGVSLATLGGWSGKPLEPASGAVEGHLRAEFEQQADLWVLYVLTSSGRPPGAVVQAVREITSNPAWRDEIHAPLGFFDQVTERTRQRLAALEAEAGRIAGGSMGRPPEWRDSSALQTVLRGIPPRPAVASPAPATRRE